jgi:hypothetical protein
MSEANGWRPISTAPRDGTVVDLWIGEDYGWRRTDCYWGVPEHSCGEAGVHCDSDWHGMADCWVDSTFNAPLAEEEPTHWQPLPPPPEAARDE